MSGRDDLGLVVFIIGAMSVIATMALTMHCDSAANCRSMCGDIGVARYVNAEGYRRNICECRGASDGGAP